jgi:hypothetical protein
MISKKQLLANQNNAQLGGVKTDEGKIKVRFNALKHGIWGTLISEYESDIYQDLLTDLMDELRPQGIIQNMMVERIAVAYLRMYRLAKAENEFIQATLNPSSPEITLKFNDDGYDSRIDKQAVSAMLDVYSRYETTIENHFYRALKELQSYKNGFVLQKGQI